MAKNSAIEWTDHTFNPWIGCSKVSPGCDHCYAEAMMDKRMHKVKWGAGQPRIRTSAANWAKPLQWNKQPFCECMNCHWRGEEREASLQADVPGTEAGSGAWRICPACSQPMLKEARRRVFCASLADVFDNEVPDEWRADLFDLIDATPNLDWLLLTKRIGNVVPMLKSARRMRHGIDAQGIHVHPRQNVWIGATIVNQEEAERDIPKLLGVPAAKRFLSMEPLLGPVDLARWVATANVTCKECKHSFWLHEANPCKHRDGGAWTLACPHCGGCKCQPGWTPADARSISMEPPADWIERTVGRFDRVHPTVSLHSAIDWVIVGGESGNDARPMHPDWARDLRDQCEAASVPFLFKQWGEWVPRGPESMGYPIIDDVPRRRITDAGYNGQDLAAAGGSDVWMQRAGKKAAGRLLDGALHDGYPEVA